MRAYRSAKTLEELFEAIERNRHSNIDRSLHDHAGLYSGSIYDEKQHDELNQTDPAKVRLVLFAFQGPFIESVTAMLKPLTTFMVFEDPESAITFVLEYKVRHVILDLDKPSNCSQSIDVYSALKTLDPDISIFACTKNHFSIEARGLQTKGAILLKKPLLRRQLEEFVRQYLR